METHNDLYPAVPAKEDVTRAVMLQGWRDLTYLHWPYDPAAVEHIDDQLIEAAGYPAPRGAPLVHYSPGIEVRIGRPRWVDSVRTAGRRASS
jgi:uncharacterized protein YqjF (DUF2071 family)